jgi:type II secretory ATPase GspE/PulE/Tfp pilus assembly ATPase PilB-like protein
MVRSLGILSVAAAWFLGCGDIARAEDSSAWPIFPLPDDWRGPGFYLSWPKLVAVWLLFLLWAGTTAQINADAEEHNIKLGRWNTISLGSFAGALVFLLIVPWFWVGFPLLAIGYGVPLALFVKNRDAQVNEKDRWLTAGHLRRLASRWLRPLGIKIETHRPAGASAVSSAVRLTPRGEGPVDASQRMADAVKSAGFRTVPGLLEDAMNRRAETVTFDSSTPEAAMRYLIDGVWNDVASPGQEVVREALQSLRLLCGMHPQASGRREVGQFAVHFEGTTTTSVLTAQGVAGGERAAIQFQIPRATFHSLDELGMPEAMQNELRGLISQPKGLILLAGLPGSGLRSTITAVLQSSDRYLRDFAVIEDEADRQAEVENVPVVTFQAGGPETPAEVLRRLIRTEPAVIAVRSPLDQGMGSLVCQHGVENRMFLGTIRATSGAEALLRFLALKVPAADFAPAITAVLYQRLVRRLCPHCKEACELPPEVVRQFTLLPGETPIFFRPPLGEPSDASGQRKAKHPKVCSACGGLGYMGRTAVFELLVVNRTIRKILQIGPQTDLITQAAQRVGMRTLQEEGLRLVAQGVTSLAELTRALK